MKVPPAELEELARIRIGQIEDSAVKLRYLSKTQEFDRVSEVCADLDAIVKHLWAVSVALEQQVKAPKSVKKSNG